MIDAVAPIDGTKLDAADVRAIQHLRQRSGRKVEGWNAFAAAPDGASLPSASCEGSRTSAAGLHKSNYELTSNLPLHRCW
jgi:hypothetical protein